MTIKITGKNIDLGDALRDHALDQIEQAVEKYFSRPISGQMFVEKANGMFSTTCSLHLHSGFDVQTSGRASDAYGSVNEACEKLEKQLRRYKRRLKNHHAHAPAAPKDLPADAMDYVIESGDESREDAGEGAPAIIAERPTALRRLTVSDAVMQLDLTDSPFVIFRNSGHGEVNVVYRREDGNIGWIDPSMSSLKKD
ncbi:MAG: ribosome-associated translation inhibitor RaiA [Hyphomicrobiales bacterium]|nr:ribosome-associated translation inhibitor RaiA [Hyphomicrobiales bacterium]